MRFALALVLTTCGTVACGSPPAPLPPPAPAPKPVASAAPDDQSGFVGKEFSLHRSDRFGISIPLPDKPAWTIVDRDDQNGGWIVATHGSPTNPSTKLRARRFDETSLVGRRECELRAQLVGELPKEQAIEQGKMQVLSDEPIHRPAGWDGRRLVAFEVRPGGGLTGHVWLVSGKHHWCLVVHVTAEVKSDTEADALADRLELFASRTIGGVTADRAKEPDLPIPDLPMPKSPTH